MVVTDPKIYSLFSLYILWIYRLMKFQAKKESRVVCYRPVLKTLWGWCSSFTLDWWLGRENISFKCVHFFSSWFFEALIWNSLFLWSWCLEIWANATSHNLESWRLGTSRMRLNRVVKYVGWEEDREVRPLCVMAQGKHRWGCWVWHGGILEMECRCLRPRYQN